MTLKREDRKQGLTQAVSLAEWIASLASYGVILALAGFLVFELLTGSIDAPRLRLETRSVTMDEQQFKAVVVVENQGDRAARHVEIVGALAGGGQTRAVTLDYAPPRSRREVTLVFDQPFQARQLSLSVTGYVSR